MTDTTFMPGIENPITIYIIIGYGNNASLDNVCQNGRQVS